MGKRWNHRRNKIATALLTTLLLAGWLDSVPPTLGQANECAGGIVHDDGTFENGYGSGSFLFAHYVMRIDPPFSPADLEAICICWTRTSPDASITFDVVVWDSDGPGGAPGTLLGTLETVTATGVPQTVDPPPVTSRFYRYDLSSVGISSSRPIYVGPAWDSGDEADFFLCADENGATTQPAYEDIGLLAGMRPPMVALGTAGTFPNYRTLGIRAVASIGEALSLSQMAGLIVPGFEVAVDEPEGTTTLFAVRNTSDDAIDVEVAYHGDEITDTPLRTDVFTLAARQTLPWSLRDDLSNLAVADGVAGGLILISEAGGSSAPNLEGDYFQVDSANDFAGGDRLVRPSELCNLQEIRFVDFGSGSTFRVLVDTPRGGVEPSFGFTAYDEAGIMVAEGTFFTSDHLNVLGPTDLGITQAFGTLVFDFSSSGGGWVSARYSAFGRFSVDLKSACRDG